MIKISTKTRYGLRALLELAEHKGSSPVNLLNISKKQKISYKYLENIFNLLKNAIYYVEKAGKGNITIKLKRGRKLNQLIFTDTGTGISKDIMPHIFEHFFTKTENGVGIGLAFCKMVMQNLDGDMTCESHEGEHTKFTLSFPVLNKK